MENISKNLINAMKVLIPSYKVHIVPISIISLKLWKKAMVRRKKTHKKEYIYPIQCNLLDRNSIKPLNEMYVSAKVRYVSREVK